MNVIDGKTIAESIRNGLKKRINASSVKPCLAVVLVGEDPASKIYVRLKKKACEEIGIISLEHRMPEETTQDELLRLVDKLNSDKDVHGILIQLPLPSHIDANKVIENIVTEKDVDGFTSFNAGKLMQGKDSMEPCTPKGIMRLLDKYEVDIMGKNAVVIGRSNIVGKPIAMMLLRRHATVTLCHSKTKNLGDITKKADILVAAVGKPGMITEEMVKPGAVVVDVGTNRISDGKLVGDVDFEGVKEIAGLITPVPGGVGPMTIAMLLENTVDAAKIPELR
ncbi:bifunctional methylenetetrahydrofolate dehydrogenase/methenyltetrahydrofolate cyclohydrolase FolD [Candidatus Woesearchaeota archaeon CG11_big_fil_rev_8_21_14_0_20_43_8]|nr:MAG: bifunctional methylenetetrahydrofolate dehydrogenase/methenyltetrahydrofolate cyclohydrolase FolD [Candidatus Woesearchaeota archaeon CG11_big_fil_rev_8_21_14_0_20_43_8]PIO04653.1 MAG: bifunctional methylenetetrahydrofolate dehydrogenase/methenyltetrahydrofolate cyclohydrolase FolD [Candidatus Woesearchaeota archaeon CG08_land_8_20_14_0_20_43_7]